MPAKSAANPARERTHRIAAPCSAQRMPTQASSAIRQCIGTTISPGRMYPSAAPRVIAAVHSHGPAAAIATPKGAHRPNTTARAESSPSTKNTACRAMLFMIDCGFTCVSNCSFVISVHSVSPLSVTPTPEFRRSSVSACNRTGPVHLFWKFLTGL